MPSTPPLRKSREYSPCEFSESVRALKHTSRKHTTMHPNNILATALIAAITVAACCPSVGAASWSPTEQAMDKMLAIVQTQLETTGQAIEDTLELDGTQATADPQEQQPIARTGHNSIFYCPTPIPDLIEYNLDSCYVSTIRKPVNFGKGLGNGELIINFENVRRPHFIVKLNGSEVLNEPRGNAESSLAAYDFDGDGRKEVFYQDGDLFNLTVFGFKGRRLEELGSVTCNNGLIITDDGSPEQLFIGEDPHGFSYLRLQIPGSRESYDLLHLMDHDDTVAFRYDGYDIRLRDMVQPSAKDNFKYNRDKELELIKRYVQN